MPPAPTKAGSRGRPAAGLRPGGGAAEAVVHALSCAGCGLRFEIELVDAAERPPSLCDECFVLYRRLGLSEGARLGAGAAIEPAWPQPPVRPRARPASPFDAEWPESDGRPTRPDPSPSDEPSRSLAAERTRSRLSSGAPRPAPSSGAPRPAGAARARPRWLTLAWWTS